MIVTIFDCVSLHPENGKKKHKHFIINFRLITVINWVHKLERAWILDPILQIM